MGLLRVLATEAQTMVGGFQAGLETAQAFVDAGSHCLRHLIMFHAVPSSSLRQADPDD